MTTFILLDSQNLFFRARHVVRGDDLETKIGMCMHIIMNSIAKVYHKQGGKHLVACFEGRSWRKEYYTPYKANRPALRKKQGYDPVEDQAFFDAFNELRDYLRKSTHATVLSADGCEADDFIARWIQNHPNDQHIIVSSDTDFFQLLAENVTIYNGITDHTITLQGYFDNKGNPVKDKKGNAKTIANPEYLLFEKCIRGDSSDNIFSAYPGVRKKGSRNTVGIEDAFHDRNGRGYFWNNFFLQRWSDHDGKEHRVLEDYMRNKTLIDLTQQPQQIKDIMDDEILNSVIKEPVSQLGVLFLRFCGKHNLMRIGDNPTYHLPYLKARYNA